MNLLQKPSNPSARDYALCSEFMRVLKLFVKDGNCERWLEEEQQKSFMSIGEAKASVRLQKSNFGNTNVTLRIISQFCEASIYVISKQVLDAKVVKNTKGVEMKPSEPSHLITLVREDCRRDALK